MMRHADIRTKMNIYGDVTDQMTTASSKVAQLAFPSNGAQTESSEGSAVERMAPHVGLESTVKRSFNSLVGPG